MLGLPWEKESYEEKHPSAHLRREKPKSSTMTRQLYLLLILPLLPPKKSTQGLGPDVLESCSLLMWANSFQRAIMLVFLTVTQLWWLGDQYYWPGLTQCIISHCLPVHCLRCCLVQHLVLSIPTFRLFLQDVVVCLSKLDGLRVSSCSELEPTPLLGSVPCATGPPWQDGAIMNWPLVWDFWIWCPLPVVLEILCSPFVN